MRASMGGPPASRNKVTMTNVSTPTTALRVTSSSNCGPLVGDSTSTAARTGPPGCTAARVSAEPRSSSTCRMKRASGVMRCLMVCSVSGAVANQCCAGFQTRSMAPPASARVRIKMSRALTPRGTRQRCSASTGPDKIRANSNASARGVKAACAWYSNRPRAPITRSLAACILRGGRFPAIGRASTAPVSASTDTRTVSWVGGRNLLIR